VRWPVTKRAFPTQLWTPSYLRPGVLTSYAQSVDAYACAYAGIQLRERFCENTDPGGLAAGAFSSRTAHS